MRVNDLGMGKLVESDDSELERYNARVRVYALELLMEKAQEYADTWLYERLPGYMKALALNANESPQMKKYVDKFRKPIFKELARLVNDDPVAAYDLIDDLKVFNEVGITWPEIKGITDKIKADLEQEAAEFEDDEDYHDDENKR